MRIQVADSQSLHAIEKIIIECCEDSCKSLRSCGIESRSYQRRVNQIGLWLVRALRAHCSVNTNESFDLRPLVANSFNPEFLPLVQADHSIHNQSEEHYDELILAIRQCSVRIKNYDIRHCLTQIEIADTIESETELEFKLLAATLENAQDSIKRIHEYKDQVKETKVSEYTENERIFLADVLSIL